MGRHVNGDAEVDDGSGSGGGSGEPIDSGSDDSARHAASGVPDELLEPQAVISPDTHVGVDIDELPPGTQDAAPSPARPDALVEHGAVGDGHEME